ncbi:MAG: malonyl-[acyl-carrier protein] O-methyltransferase BioC [Betaproteobacteria bacterium HGW-Betaproteobacteria-13]|nr:MAG: malonyl-[acyl-carrier protein] O-methyltransferase BioC [Betaproteobacteria bacterium HGW-Betaproteobacteria-13]
MAQDSNFQLDRRLLKRRFDRAATRYDSTDVLAREIARRMDERLDYIKITPKRIIDLGCGTGSDLLKLATRFPEAELLGLDFSLPMLEQCRQRTTPQTGPARRLLGRLTGSARRGTQLIAADASALPLPRASVSLAWSNLMLPGLHDPLPALQELHRVLEVGGLLMFSSFGPDTLRELREALPDQAGERVHRFIDMHDIGDVLVKAGFSDPVMDMEMLTLTYNDLDSLLNDLRASGGNNAASSRPRGLSGRSGWAAARAHYEKMRTEGRLPATFEVIQGHAWKAPAKTTEDGRAVIQFRPRQTDSSSD